MTVKVTVSRKMDYTYPAYVEALQSLPGHGRDAKAIPFGLRDQSNLEIEVGAEVNAAIEDVPALIDILDGYILAAAKARGVAFADDPFQLPDTVVQEEGEF